MSSKVVDAGAVRALARQRHDVIVAEVRRRGAVRVSELAALLGVSDMTIRRDLEMLDETGLVTKVHGGATLRAERSSDEPGFEAKSLRNMAEKHAIAMAAAAMVTPGSAIGITAGTTTWQLAYHLVDIPHLTVVTNSVRVSDVLYRAPRPDRTVVLTGGDRTPSDALVGPVALATLRTLHLDMVCMGVHGMSAEAGFTTPNLQEAEVNRAFVDSTQELVVLADGTAPDEVYDRLSGQRLSVAPVVDGEGRLIGCATRTGALRSTFYRPAVDKNGQLMVAVAVGINGDPAAKAKALVAMGADVLVIDTAHGHQTRTLRAIEEVRAVLPPRE